MSLIVQFRDQMNLLVESIKCPQMNINSIPNATIILKKIVVNSKIISKFEKIHKFGELVETNPLMYNIKDLVTL